MNGTGELHGATGTKEHNAWRAMKRRCLCKTDPAYTSYGGRGITICNKWVRSFESFRSDLGLAPGDNYTLDRINNNEGYYKENCRWATMTLQNRNKGNVKLTMEKAKEIRRLYKRGYINAYLARKYNVCHALITRILKNEIWITQ